MTKDYFSSENEVKSNWMKFTQIGDYILGTLVDVREMQSQLPGKEGEIVKVYEIKAAEGEFHEIDDKKHIIEAPVTVVEGEFYNVGGKPKIDVQMRKVKLGQIVGLKMTDEKPSKTKGFNPTKIIKVFTDGTMDANYQGETASSLGAMDLE